MDIHGVGITGMIPERFKATIAKIEQVTRINDWDGIKTIYMTDLIEEDHVGTRGCYVNSTGEDAWIAFELTYQNGQKEKYRLESNDMPCILINGGLFKDEYYFAANLLHELGHHHIKNFFGSLKLPHDREEINAHKIAMGFLEKGQFEKTDNIVFEYWKEATLEYQQERGWVGKKDDVCV